MYQADDFNFRQSVRTAQLCKERVIEENKTKLQTGALCLSVIKYLLLRIQEHAANQKQKNSKRRAAKVLGAARHKLFFFFSTLRLVNFFRVKFRFEMAHPSISHCTTQHAKLKRMQWPRPAPNRRMRPQSCQSGFNLASIDRHSFKNTHICCSWAAVDSTIFFL